MDKKKILIVDDEWDVLAVLQHRLAKAGYSVITAQNGHDALTAAKTYRPDLIILDLLMPGMDGGEVAGRLKDNIETEDIPVIFLTCLRLKKEEERTGPVVGDNVFLAKPYDMEGLLTQIENLLLSTENVNR